MQTMVTSRRSVPWRGVAAFALDNLIPLLGLTALVVGAFHLPGLWGQVGGYLVLGVVLIKTHDALKDDIDALKALARADRIDRERARTATVQRMRTVA